jgi:hypothetical protein
VNAAVWRPRDCCVGCQCLVLNRTAGALPCDCVRIASAAGWCKERLRGVANWCGTLCSLAVRAAGAVGNGTERFCSRQWWGLTCMCRPCTVWLPCQFCRVCDCHCAVRTRAGALCNSSTRGIAQQHSRPACCCCVCTLNCVFVPVECCWWMYIRVIVLT